MYISECYVTLGAIDITQKLPLSRIKHMIPFDITTLFCPSRTVFWGGSLSAHQFVQHRWERVRVGFRRLESSCKFASGVHTTWFPGVWPIFDTYSKPTRLHRTVWGKKNFSWCFLHFRFTILSVCFLRAFYVEFVLVQSAGNRWIKGNKTRKLTGGACTKIARYIIFRTGEAWHPWPRWRGRRVWRQSPFPVLPPGMLSHWIWCSPSQKSYTGSCCMNTSFTWYVFKSWKRQGSSSSCSEGGGQGSTLKESTIES